MVGGWLMDVRFRRGDLEAFCESVFRSLGLRADDARISAEVLVAADACGIPSHGVARLGRYANGLRSGLMVAAAEPTTEKESLTSLVVNAHGGMGAPVSHRTMQRVIEKACHSGAAFGCVKNSNHFGIAGYYAKMALPHNLLGIAMTNTATLGVPTFGRLSFFGTNPLAFAAPAGRETSFVLDMSTTVVTRGKVEVYDRMKDSLPDGWAVDPRGQVVTNPRELLDDLQNRRGGGILPLGGFGTLGGGHKGYGLAVMVDILCAVLCGDAFGRQVFDTPTSSARVSHFFGAIDIGRFRDIEEFQADMDRMLLDLRNAEPADGAERVYYAGLPEREAEDENDRLGVPLLPVTCEKLRVLGAEWGIRLPSPA